MRVDGRCEGKHSQRINLLRSLLTLMTSAV
jgi:hypothetical protein